MKKQILSFLLVLSIIVGIMSFCVPSALANSNKCGKNVTWFKDYNTDTLIIEGTGDMDSFSPRGYISLSDIPWYDFRDFYLAIEVREGVTSVGDAAFYDMSNVTRVSLPEGLTYIGSKSFYSCDKIRHIDLPSTVTYIGDYAFQYCFDLKEIILPSSTEYIGELSFHKCEKLESIVIENPQCRIDSSRETLGISDKTVIFGHLNSTAEAYAKRHGYSFQTIDTYDSGAEYNAENYPSPINTLVKNREIWLDGAGVSPYDYNSIGFMDFEGDSIPELFINQFGGTGYGSNNLFFEVNINNDVVCEIAKKGRYYSEPDICEPSTQMMREKSTGRYVYLCNDYIRDGADYSYTDSYFLHRSPAGQIEYIPLWSTSEECGIIEYSYRSNGDTVTVDQETWEDYQTNFLSDYESVEVQFETWEYNELRACNEQELADALMQMYKIFYEGGNLDPHIDKNASSTEKDEGGVQIPSVTYAKSFNEYFVENKVDNVQELVDYESVARVVCEESSSAEIYWNAYRSALSDSEFLSVDNIGDTSLSPLKMHHYYEAALLEAIMQTKLENDYLAAIGDRALKTAVEAASFCLQYNSAFESREDVLKRKLKEETRYLDRDGEEIQKIYEYYGTKCKILETHDVVKSIYDLCLESDATIEEFYLALSNYVEVKQASDEVLAALEYLKGRLELSDDKEDKIILTAVENVITSLTITLDTHLVYNVLGSMQDQFWNMMIGMAEDLLGEYFLVAKAAKMCIDGGLLFMDVLFPTTMSSKSYCKLYADFAIEWVVQDAIYAAYDEYSISPRKEMADAIVGLYDVLAYTYQHEIRVGDILVDQLHKDGLLNGLRNLVSSSNMEDYRYEKACIQSYDAYLAEITKVKVEAQREYGIAIGKLQPVYIVYFINGKALLFEEFTAETGVPYIPPVERAQTVADVLGFTADVFGFTANVMGVYVDSSMKKAYDDTVPVSGPVTLFMDVGLFYKSDGTPALVDPATNVSITKTGIPANTKISVTKEMEGTDYKAATTRFEGKAIEMYDISLSAEEGEVQPSGTVTVSIPLKADYEGNDVSVYYMASNGTYEDMEAMVEDGYCKFTTTHFSTYVIVYESTDTLNNLTMTIVIASTVAVSALVVLIVIIRARRKKRKS